MVSKKTEDKDANTTPEGTAQRVLEKSKKKGKKEIEKKNSVLKRMKIDYMNVDDLKPNEYNPNRQSEHDFELLKQSIIEDGFTQAITVRKDLTIIDGEHRWRAAIALGFKEIPVVVLDQDKIQAMISTLRMNRARGSEDIELTAVVLRDLQELGALDWAQDSLIMDDVEMNRMLDDISAPDELADEEFSEAWEPDKVGDAEQKLASEGSTQAVEYDSTGGKNLSAMTEGAIKTIREREKKIREAKTQEERDMAKADGDIYRISLIFSGTEADIVKTVLGTSPAKRLVELCKKELPK